MNVTPTTTSAITPDAVSMIILLLLIRPLFYYSYTYSGSKILFDTVVVIIICIRTF